MTGRVQTPSHFEAVDVRQLDVEQHDRRAEPLGFGDAALAVRRLADDVVSLRRQQGTRGASERSVIVDDEHGASHAGDRRQLCGGRHEGRPWVVVLNADRAVASPEHDVQPCARPAAFCRPHKRASTPTPNASASRALLRQKARTERACEIRGRRKCRRVRARSNASSATPGSGCRERAPRPPAWPSRAPTPAGPCRWCTGR